MFKRSKMLFKPRLDLIFWIKKFNLKFEILKGLKTWAQVEFERSEILILISLFEYHEFFRKWVKI